MIVFVEGKTEHSNGYTISFHFASKEVSMICQYRVEDKAVFDSYKVGEQYELVLKPIKL